MIGEGQFRTFLESEDLSYDHDHERTACARARDSSRLRLHHDRRQRIGEARDVSADPWLSWVPFADPAAAGDLVRDRPRLHPDPDQSDVRRFPGHGPVIFPGRNPSQWGSWGHRSEWKHYSWRFPRFYAGEYLVEDCIAPYKLRFVRTGFGLKRVRVCEVI